MLFIWCLCCKSNDLYISEFISELHILVLWSVCFYCQYCIILITIALKYSLKSGSMIPPALLSLKISLAIQGLQSQIPWGFSVPLPDPHVGKSVVGPRTFLTVWEFIWDNCSAVCGSSAQWLYGRVNGDLLQEGLCHTQDCCTQSPSPRGRPLLTCTSPGDIQILKGRSGSVSVGSPGVHKVLFEPSKRLWCVWGLILNVISPLLPSCWGFSFALGGGVSFFGGIQHSSVDGCSAASCNFGVHRRRWAHVLLLCHLSFHTHFSVQFTHSVVSNALWPHGVQHPRPPGRSPSPGVCSNSCPLSQWCHPTISSSVAPFSSCLQSFPASGSFPVSRLFARVLELKLQSFQWIFIL